MGAVSIGFGKALPELEVANSELERLVATNDEWISTRTGISSRRVSVKETALDLACAASCEAMGIPVKGVSSEARVESSGTSWKTVDPASIDLLVLTTITPDTIVPCCASSVKMHLGLDNAIAFDLNAACTGFIYGVTVAESMMAAANCAQGPNGRNPIRRALVVSSERLTRLTDWQDRNTCVLFGDGAGAMVLEWSDDRDGMLSSYLKNDDDADNVLTCKNAFASLQPFDREGVVFDEESKLAHDESYPDPKQVDYSYIRSLDILSDPASDVISTIYGMDRREDEGGPGQYIYMNGQKVFKFAARAMESALRTAVSRAGLQLEDIDCIVPHQANLRIIEFAAKRLGLPLDKFQISIGTTGNTSSSGVPMALSDAVASGKVSRGSKVALVAFGGGLTSGAVVMEL